jgi:two-component system, response regulator PdtaR
MPESHGHRSVRQMGLATGTMIAPYFLPTSQRGTRRRYVCVEPHINTTNNPADDGQARRPIRIAIADAAGETRGQLAQLVAGPGFEVVASTGEGGLLIAQSLETHPDLAVIGARLTDTGGVEAAERLYREALIPSILLGVEPDLNVAPVATTSHLLAILTEPVRPMDLRYAITLGLGWFQRLQAQTREISGLREALEDRKLIERAKGAVTRRLQVGEQEAFDRMRKLANKQNRRLVDVARSVLDAEQAFAKLERG